MLRLAQQHLNMKYIILTKEEFISVVLEIQPEHVRGGTDETVLVGYDTVPAKFSSKTTYTKNEVDAIKRDSTSVYYLENF